MKKIIIFSILIYCLYSTIANAQNDYIPNDCSNLRNDYALFGVCEVARKYRTPFYKTMTAFFMAGIESAGYYCGFRTNNRFIRNKQNFLANDRKIQQVYQYFIDNSSGNFPNKTQFCQEQYSLFGPYAPRGPNGGDNRIFE